jgi:ComF family protein
VLRFFEGFIALVAPQRCAGCDEPSSSVFCAVCESLLEPAEMRGAVFEYGGPIAEAIHRFKYRGPSALSTALGALMGEAAAQSASEIDAVVPVPLHWRRRRSRGYDQAALLAIPTARALGVPALLRGLRRVRHTPSQVDLPHDERQQNVADAFAPWRLQGSAKVLLVDDVCTTGATLRAASQALQAGGVREVRTLVLAARILTEGT